MQLSVETFLKEHTGENFEPVGPTKLSLDETAYLELLKVEEGLQSAESKEVLVEANAFRVQAPSTLGHLNDARIRVYVGESGGPAHFHLVAKRSRDGALVHTEPTMLRLVAV